MWTRQTRSRTCHGAPLGLAAMLILIDSPFMHGDVRRQAVRVLKEGSPVSEPTAASALGGRESLVFDSARTYDRHDMQISEDVGGDDARSSEATSRSPAAPAHRPAVRQTSPMAEAEQLDGEEQQYCMIYMKPHKTGSQAVRAWMQTVARIYGLTFATCLDFLETNVGEHIRFYRAQKYDMYHCHGTYTPELRDAIEAGCRGTPLWVAGTRDPQSVLFSKYFWWSGKRVRREVTESRNDTIRWDGRRDWMLWWRVYDPCEALDYYDGLGHCRGNEQERLRSILPGIDLAVLAGDGEKDLACICRLNKWDVCPKTRVANRISTGYDWLYRVHSALTPLHSKDYVQVMLHEALVAEKLGRDEAVCAAVAENNPLFRRSPDVWGEDGVSGGTPEDGAG